MCVRACVSDVPMLIFEGPHAQMAAADQLGSFASESAGYWLLHVHTLYIVLYCMSE